MFTFGQGLATMKGQFCRKRTVQGIGEDDVSEIGVALMNQCDCDERIGIEINSYQVYEELRSFLNVKSKQVCFVTYP